MKVFIHAYDPDEGVYQVFEVDNASVDLDNAFLTGEKFTVLGRLVRHSKVG